MRNIGHLCTAAAALGLTAAFAGQASAQAGGPISFLISEGRVVPTQDFAVKLSVLGSALTSGGVDMPVTVEFHIADMNVAPFGPVADPVSGNVNDHAGARHHIIQQMFTGTDEITVTATSWDGGEVNYSHNSHDQSPYVKVLRDGDDVPDIPGFQDQASIADYVGPYIDPATGKISLHENQVIYLFEIGVTDLEDDAADFQDLVALITLGESPEVLEILELLGSMYD